MTTFLLFSGTKPSLSMCSLESKSKALFLLSPKPMTLILTYMFLRPQKSTPEITILL